MRIVTYKDKHFSLRKHFQNNEKIRNKIQKVFIEICIKTGSAKTKKGIKKRAKLALFKFYRDFKYFYTSLIIHVKHNFTI